MENSKVYKNEDGTFVLHLTKKDAQYIHTLLGHTTGYVCQEVWSELDDFGLKAGYIMLNCARNTITVDE